MGEEAFVSAHSFRSVFLARSGKSWHWKHLAGKASHLQTARKQRTRDEGKIDASNACPGDLLLPT